MFDNAPIEFDCPQCAHKIEKTIGWLTSHDKMTCEGCGVTINLDMHELAGSMKQLEDALDSIPKEINIKF
jgi:transcription elongation factor Elf1